MDTMATNLGIRIIAPDRPGIGLSSFQIDRNFLDWAQDVGCLADQLDVKTFSIFGLSGGAPHVLACAFALPHRIQKAAIVCGTGPHNYRGKLKGMWFPVKLVHWFAGIKNDSLLRRFIRSEYKELKENPEKRLSQLQRFLPDSDRKLFKEHPEYGLDFINGSLEAYKQGVDGVVQEWQLYVRDWGIPLSEITTPIDLWYGGEDKMAPKYRGIHYQEILQNSKLHVFEDEGHFSLIRNHLHQILNALVGV
jgi:pimeloyl-ACP methyl ester carboxylesterase